MSGAAETMTRAPGTARLADALEIQRDRLMPCVHCGFCLPACPTYERLGDEADSPRGRLHLMKAVVEGRLDAGSDAFQTHIDRCLGCRACEPVCPSGVEYGTLLELARETASRARSPGFMTRALLFVMGSGLVRRIFFAGGRIVRASGLAAVGARVLPSSGPLANVRFAMAMLAATRAPDFARGRNEARDEGDDGRDAGVATPVPPTVRTAARGTVAVLGGCVQAGLYARINDATERTLRANGYEIVRVGGQGCCGALHAHGGDLDGARRLARRNIEAFERAGADHVAVNAAGCGAAMKEYGTLFASGGDADMLSRAEAIGARVRDVTELLADAGPRSGAEVTCSVAYDHPCHLLHAQRVSDPPLRVLAAVPGVEVRVVDRADECCGGAGIYGMTHPELGGEIGRDKVDAVRRTEAGAACTPNPGCMMQIGAGLQLAGSPKDVLHPVEILDESYRRAGLYR